MPDTPVTEGYAEWLAAFHKRLTEGGLSGVLADDLLRSLGDAVFNGRCVVRDLAVNA
jgi:hypothetical protein